MPNLQARGEMNGKIFLALIMLGVFSFAFGSLAQADAIYFRNHLGKTITLEGRPLDAKLGALLEGGDFSIWIDGLDRWPEKIHVEGEEGKRVRATGTVIEKYDLPVFIPVKGEPVISGISVAEGTDLHEASHRYLLKDVKWEVMEENTDLPFPCNEVTCTSQIGHQIKALKKEYEELLSFIQPPVGTSRESVEKIYGKRFRFINQDTPYKGRTPQYQYRIPAEIEDELLAIVSVGYDNHSNIEWIEFPNPFGFLISRASPPSKKEMINGTIKYYGICIDKFKKIRDKYYEQLKSASWNRKLEGDAALSDSKKMPGTRTY